MAEKSLDAARAYLRAIGSRGGKTSSRRMTAEERKARAAAAGRASGVARKKKATKQRTRLGKTKQDT